MKLTHLARALSAILLGVLFGYYVQHDFLRWNQRGKGAFLAYQAHRFDQSMAAPHPTAITVIAMTIVIVFGFAIYELVVAVVSKIMGAWETNLHGPGEMQ